MARLMRLAAMVLCMAMVSPATLLGQFPSELVGFNSPPIDDPATAQEMFRIPQFSGTTSPYLLANTTAFGNNAAFRASGLQTEGAAALQVFFRWLDPADPDAWVRLTTFDGPVRPNPALDVRGKVRFKVTNKSELFRGTVGMCLGIRESGNLVAQLANGGTAGPIEWVGVDTTINAIIAGANGIVDTAAAGDDVQIHAVGANVAALPLGTAVIGPGPNGVIDTLPAGDDQTRYGYFIAANGTRTPIPALTLPPAPFAYTVEWNLATGQVSLNGVPQGGGIVGFTGDNVLSAPNDRGTLEHIAITNIDTDAAILIDFAIDELQFEALAPDPTPAPAIVAPVVNTNTFVQVNCVAGATSAALYRNGNLAGTEVPFDGLATFGPLVLNVGDVLTATQTANGMVSPFSAPVIVFAAGTALADNFDSYASQAELEAVWQQTAPANPRRPLLAQGGAASCENMIFVETAGETSRLYYNLGQVNGTDAEPLLVTYWYKHSSNNANARDRFELTPSLTRVFGALGFAFTNGVGGLHGQQYTSMTSSPTPVIAGYVSDYFNYDYALTGVAREADVWQKMQIEIKSAVVNFYINDQLANPLDPVTLEPVWPGGVPRVNNDAFQYIIIGTGFSTNGSAFMYDNLSVTLGGAPVPFGPPNPVPSPTPVGPLFPGQTTVTADGVLDTADTVSVFANGVLVGTANGPFVGGTAAVPVTALTNAALVNATQTQGGTESCLSSALTVSVPAPAVQATLLPGQATVQVSNIEENLASEVTVYRDLGEGERQPLGQALNPTTDPVTVVTIPIEQGWILVATQTIGGVESPASAGVEVRDPGAIRGWIQTTSLPAGLTDHGAVYLNGYVYVIGGRSDASGTAATPVYYAPVNENGSLGVWTTTTSLPVPLATHGVAAHNGRVYAWGGWTAGFATRNTGYYATQNPNGSLGAWTLSAQVLPNNTDVSPQGTQMDAFGRGVMAHNGVLYTINGEWDSGAAFGNTNSCYFSVIQPNGDYGPWQQTTSTATATGSWFHGVAVIQGNTKAWKYRVAGNYRGTNERDMLRAEILPGGALGTWEADPNLFPVGRYEHACAVVRNRWIFVVGGLFGATTQNTVHYTRVNRATGELTPWVQAPNYPLSLSRLTSVTYEAGGKTYLLVVSGGPYTGAGRNPSCYYAQVGLYYNMSDLANFQACYAPGTPVDPACAEDHDLNDDGVVNSVDFFEFLETFIGL